MLNNINSVLPTAIAASPHVKAGRLRAIAVTSTKRIGSMPEVPTVAESGVPGFEAVSWGGVMAPAGTPKPVIDRLHDELIKILEMPDASETLQSLGAEIVGSTPEEFAAYLKSEIDKWSKVAREANVKLD